jgi:arsenate reductase
MQRFVIYVLSVIISNHLSQSVDEFKDMDFYAVITVCDKARESCPVWFGKTVKKIHNSFEDPPFLSKDSKTGEALAHYRRVRDEIKNFILKLPEI